MTTRAPLPTSTSLAVSIAEGTKLTRSLLAALAALLLFWGLDSRYLWQDEAATALLASSMLKSGRPLAYDGGHLVTIDYFISEDPDTIAQRTGDPQTAVDYYIRRGDLKPDTAWKWQPWGQFAVAAASLGIFGRHTLAARLPFALAGVATILLFYRLVFTYCRSGPMAALSSLLLLSNTYWILHSRQCRYYSLSSLLLVLTLLTYLGWQRGERLGGAAFVLAAWCWFQADYGTVWPVFAVLFLDALLARRRSFSRTAAMGLALAAAIAPFFYYYQLWGRHMQPSRARLEIFYINLFNTNEYVAPLVVILAAGLMAAYRWKQLAAGERHLVAVSCGILLVLLLWVPLATPEAFLRYVIMAAPLGSLLGVWVLVRGVGVRAACLGTLALALTPLASLPARLLVPEFDRYEAKTWWRTELRILVSEIFGNRPDPNRLTVEWFRRNALPSDEILINYEDLPLAFYLPNPIRGGIAAFRAEDDTVTPPRFLVMRHSVDFYHKPVFDREIHRYQWQQVPVQIPDLAWGNNPDPMMWENYPATGYLTLARRLDPR
jgi:hypothetical protein